MSLGIGQLSRQALPFAFLLAFGGAVVAPPDAAAQASRCRTSNCFIDNAIRHHEVIDDATVVIYVGQERCPYLVRVDQLYCDVTFLADIHFIKTRGRTQRGGVNRVCTYDTGLAIDPLGQFGVRFPGAAGGPVDPLSGGSLPCRVMEFRPVTDDELMEIYVEEGLVAPPPPIGTGQISRADEDEEGEAESETDGSAGAADTEE